MFVEPITSNKQKTSLKPKLETNLAKAKEDVAKI